MQSVCERNSCMGDSDDAMPKIRVEVAFALPRHQEIIALWVNRGCTAAEAIRESEIQSKMSEYSYDEAVCGIFSRPLNGREMPFPEDYILEENDRVELYRPLEKDPKQTRLDRIKKSS